jgi:hypothetical protein
MKHGKKKTFNYLHNKWDDLVVKELTPFLGSKGQTSQLIVTMVEILIKCFLLT